MSVGKDFAESDIVLGRDPVFQEGHIFLLKSLEEKICFKIMDMADDDDNVTNLLSFRNIPTGLLEEAALCRKIRRPL